MRRQVWITAMSLFVVAAGSGKATLRSTVARDVGCKAISCTSFDDCGDFCVQCWFGPQTEFYGGLSGSAKAAKFAGVCK